MGRKSIVLSALKYERFSYQNSRFKIAILRSLFPRLFSSVVRGFPSARRSAFHFENREKINETRSLARQRGRAQRARAERVPLQISTVRLARRRRALSLSYKPNDTSWLHFFELLTLGFSR